MPTDQHITTKPPESRETLRAWIKEFYSIRAGWCKLLSVIDMGLFNLSSTDRWDSFQAMSTLANALWPVATIYSRDHEPRGLYRGRTQENADVKHFYSSCERVR